MTPFAIVTVTVAEAGVTMSAPSASGSASLPPLDPSGPPLDPKPGSGGPPDEPSSVPPPPVKSDSLALSPQPAWNAVNARTKTKTTPSVRRGRRDSPLLVRVLFAAGGRIFARR